VSAGAYHTLFLKKDGTLWGAGWNAAGQLGNGNNDDQATPVLIGSGVTVFAAGYAHSVFTTATGPLRRMGYNGFGQLGNGTTDDQNTPDESVAPAGDATAVAPFNLVLVITVTH
jgi:alpha-tubulin suppressor-like RCC1 family protein